MMSSSCLAVVLAAGGGSRFHGSTHKLNARLGTGTVASTSIQTAIDADIGDVIVVTGAIELVDLPAGITIVANQRWADGQATSLQRAIGVARERDVGAIVVGLADQPGIPVQAWRRVAAAPTPIAVATYGGLRANPVKLDASVWELMPTDGDSGARSVFGQYQNLVGEVPCKGSPDDIDTWEDLRKWQNESSTNSP